MNIDNMLTELREERDRINEVIVAFERISERGGKRRGRPPAWMVAAQMAKSAESPAEKPKRGRPRKAS